MKKKGLNASSLRIFMITMFVILVLASIGGFYFVQNWLNTQALLIDKKDDATQQTSTTAQLTPQQSLAATKAAEIFETSNYQSKVKQDLDVYAQKTNLTVLSVEPAEAPRGAPVAPVNGASVQNLKVNLKDPVKSSNLIKFIKAIESNLPVMRLTSLKISGGGNSDDSVKVDELTIQVYIKG